MGRGILKRLEWTSTEMRTQHRQTAPSLVKKQLRLSEIAWPGKYSVAGDEAAASMDCV